MKTKRFLLLAVVLAALNVANSAKAQFLLDCTCLSTQSVLITNACQAVIPDLCQFTNCWPTTVVPPPPLTCSQSPPAGTPVGPGTYGITVTIMDPNGTAQSCALLFTVNPPPGAMSLICATNKTVECGTPWIFDPPVGTNVCCPIAGVPGGAIVFLASLVTNGTCPEMITATWQAFDGCMLSATCTQLVTVVDTTLPVLNCNCLTNGLSPLSVPMTVTNCQDVIPDLCALAILCTVEACGPLHCSQSPPPGTPVGPGVHPITITMLDCALNSATCMVNFTVVSPVGGPFTLLCAPNKTVECGTTWIFDPPTATNTCCPIFGVPGGVLLTVVSTVTNGACPEIITITWKATDGCGATATCSQTVTVVDTVPPILTCVCITNSAAIPVILTVTQCNGTIPDLCLPALTCAFDACGPLTCSQTPAPGTIVGPGVYPITVTVTDCASNSASCTFNYTVVSPGPFAIVCAPNKTVECGTTWTFDPPRATNNCCPVGGTSSGVTVVSVTTVTNGSCPEIITRTWTVMDGCSNTVSCSQTVTVVDTTPPVLDCNCLSSTAGNPLLPPLIVTACLTNIPDFCPAARLCATDNCGPITCSQTPPPGTIVGPGSYNITVTITDCASNSVSCTLHFTVFAPPGGCCVQPPGNMVAWWPLDELTGATLFADATGNGHTALVESGGPLGNPLSPVPMAGQVAGSSYFIDNSTRGRALNAPLLNFGAASFTMDCWFWPVDQGPFNRWQPFIDKFNPNTLIGYTVGITNYISGPNNFGRVAITVGDGTASTYYSVATVNMSAWNFVGIIVDRTANTVRFNINGAIEPPIALTLGGSVNNALDLLLGATQTGMNVTEVRLDEIELFNRALGTNELTDIWAAGSFGKCKTNGCVVSIFCPTNQSATASCTQACAVVNYPLPLIAYGMLSSCAPPPGFCFPTGVTTVTCVATNVCGQPGQPAVCSFTVTVNPATNCCDCNFINGDFSTPVPVNATGGGWTSYDVFGGAGWQPSGGNPGGTFLLNNVGDPATDPTIEQRLCCLTPGQCYTIRGQRKVQAWFGQTQPSFAVLLDGTPILVLPVPSNPADANWYNFAVSFTATNACQTIGFASEFNGTDVSYWIDNISLECCPTNPCSVSITCPADISMEICGPQEVVTYPTPVAISSCGSPIVSLVCTPPSGSLFNLGVTTVTCFATDAQGNSASCSFTVFLSLDSTPPVINCACVQAAIPSIARVCAYTVPDLCQLRNCFSDNCTPPPLLTCTQSPPAGTVLPAGSSYIITLTITDAAGNVSVPCTVGVSVIAPTDSRVWLTGGTGAQAANFTVIQTPSGPANIPAVLTSPAGGAWAPNGPSSSWVSFTPNSQSAAAGVYIYRLTFNLPCTNGASIGGRFLSDDHARIYLNGAITPAFSASFTAWSPVNLTSGFVPGVNTLDVYVTNAIIWTGMRAELTNNFNCCCPEALVINCPTVNLRGWVCSANASANVPFNVTATSRCPTPGVTTSVVCVPPSPGPFPIGVSSVFCTATDSLGNTAGCAFQVTVLRDVTPPVITCPAPITINTCSNSVRVYYKARAVDDCSAVTLTCVPPSGSLFNAGTVTTVTCTAVDACGNSASCSFPVRIINNLIWQLFPKGASDCYAGAWEPTAPGAILSATYPGFVWKGFDNPNVNAGVGVTWLGLPNNAIDGWLNTRAMPVWCGVPSGTYNDIIALGLPGVGGPFQWVRYWGTSTGNPSPGLLAAEWCDQTNGCATPFWIPLLNPPVPSGPSPNLLPNVNALGRFDMFVQDDTRVDFADLWLRRCVPPNLISGLPVDLANARLVIGPIRNWCIIRDNPAVATWTARINVGAVGAIGVPMSYVAKTSEAKLTLGSISQTSANSRFQISHSSNSPVAEVSLALVPPGVAEVEVILLDHGTVVSSQTLPASPGVLLASFEDDTEFTGALLSAYEGFFDFVRPSAEPGNQLCVRFLPEPAPEALTALVIEATELDALDLGAPALSGNDKLYSVTVTGDALAQADGQQVSVTPIDPESGGPVGVSYRRIPGGIGSSGQDGAEVGLLAGTNEITAYIQTALNERSGATSNSGDSIRFTAIATFSDMSSRRLPSLSFSPAADGFAVTAAGTTGAPLPLPRVQVWSNATLVVDVANPSSVVVNSIPPIYRVSASPWFVDADICHRTPWNKREIVTINGVAYQCTELRVNLPSGAPVGTSVEGIGGLDVEASGVDALVLHGVHAGPVPLKFHPPLRATDDNGLPGSELLIGWDQPWPALESAPTVLGPWTQVPTDGTEVNVRPTQTQRFFRLRE